MTRRQLFDYVQAEYSTEPEFPWHDANAVLRNLNNKKWYGIVMTVSYKKLGINKNELVDILNVKCESALIGSVLSSNGIHPAYHMNKQNWVSIRLDGSCEDETIRFLLERSRMLTSK